jgi:hypothetical protein
MTVQPLCPRCGGPLRRAEHDIGAWSRKFRDRELDAPIDELTTVCSKCGLEEALLQAAGRDPWPTYPQPYVLPRVPAA